MRVKKGNIILIVVCIFIIVIGIISMPYIYKKINTSGVDIAEKKNNTKKNSVEEITKDSDIISTLVYPIMHNDVSIPDNYYKNNSMTVTDFTNNDILYNAFLNIYEGYINNDGIVSFDSNYLVSRIENIFGPKTGYNLVDFTVPSGSFSNYTGEFKYDSESKRYTLNKVDNISNVVYTDVKSIYDASSPNDNTITTSFDVAFIKIENGKYTLYKDYNYTNEISNGEYTNMQSIENMLSTLETSKYQYTFKKDTCNYDAYCFTEGKWINE